MAFKMPTLGFSPPCLVLVRPPTLHPPHLSLKLRLPLSEKICKCVKVGYRHPPCLLLIRLCCGIWEKERNMQSVSLRSAAASPLLLLLLHVWITFRWLILWHGLIDFTHSLTKGIYIRVGSCFFLKRNGWRWNIFLGLRRTVKVNRESSEDDASLCSWGARSLPPPAWEHGSCRCTWHLHCTYSVKR